MGVFVVIRLLLSNHLCSTACNVIAFAISSSLIFQLITLYGKSVAVRKMILDRGSPIDCMGFLWFIGPLSSHSCSDYYEALQSNVFWQLNVMHVSVTLLRDTLILIMSMLGGGLGELLQSFISKLHWLFHIPVFVVISLCILLSLFAFFGCRLDLFCGLIRTDFEKQQITRRGESAPFRNNIKQLPDKKFVGCRKEEIKSLLLVNELYQKTHDYTSFVKSK
ncbi:hypothetical protein LOAG_09877 [Loa loa]|uniref:Chloride channel CLIC-like protein 1 n=1 Tax=Loa loa TaxID=7209 RepID=A0A1S0TS79_LOALO|nr:hypothetical protein LOAG_09877 [Loa loa]EFO18616.2 hypothetical protein LOAG_09877 [Loa loa]